MHAELAIKPTLNTKLMPAHARMDGSGGSGSNSGNPPAADTTDAAGGATAATA